MSVSVRFYPKGITVEVEPGSTLLEAAFLAGVEVNSACGGKATCGRCRMIVSGNFGSKQTDLILPADWNMGYRLACMTKVLGDTVAYVPEESRLNEMQILETYFGSRMEKSPLSTAVYLELRPPTLDNSVGDRERIECALKLEAGELSFPLNVLRELPGTLRRSAWKVTPVLDRSSAGLSVIEVNEWDTTFRNFGIALDIGTTTVVLSLIDLSTGNVVTQASAYNKQIMCGEDILARIAYAEDGGLDRLQRLVIDTINSLLIQVSNNSDKCKATNSRVCKEEITAMAVGGNTTMIHLFLGLHPKTIRYDPYISVTNIPPSVKAKELGIEIHPEAPIYCVPGRASYVGGDIVADVISSGMHDQEGNSLLIDVGTNGEIVLGGKDWTASCSCSAGPAFEGGEVACGMRAMPGAIERISIDDSYGVTYSTIAGLKPVGVCGSGLIDLIACLFRTGVVDKKGRIQEVKTDRVRKTDNGREFVIAWANETGQPKLKIPPSMNGVMNKAPPKRDIVVTDDDLANIIRTKAAVYAACEVLLKSVDMGFADLDQVFVAGGFGNYIDVNNAITIGLLPDIPWDKFSFIGNASLGGARLALMSQSKRDEALEVHRSMTYLELTTNASFFDRFTSASFLPHTDLSQFPSMDGPSKKEKDEMIIDTHVHIWKRTMLPDVMMEAYLEPLILLDQMFFGGKPGEKDWLAAETEPGEPVRTMDLAKIDRSVILPLDFGLVGQVQDTIEQYNDWVFEYCGGFGDRLIPFVGVDPQRGPEALRLVNKYVKSFDAKGVKVYPSTGWRPDDPKMAPFFDLIDDLGLVLVTHAGASWGPLNDELARPELFHEVVAKREGMKLVIAHLGGKYREELYQLASQNPNVYADCSALQGWLPSEPDMAVARLREASERMPGRVFFGSDWPLFDLAYCQSNWVDFVQGKDWGTDSDKERLLSGNFLNMMRS